MDKGTDFLVKIVRCSRSMIEHLIGEAACLVRFFASVVIALDV